MIIKLIDLNVDIYVKNCQRGKTQISEKKKGEKSSEHLMKNKSLERVPEGWAIWKGLILRLLKT